MRRLAATSTNSIDVSGRSESDDGDEPSTRSKNEVVGPLLYLQGLRDGRVHLVALMVMPLAADLPVLRIDDRFVTAASIFECDGRRILRYAFDVAPSSDGSYEIGGRSYALDTAFDVDLRIAFVSCNGQEAGDRGRDRSERNAMWRRLAEEHAASRFKLLLHGGDQIYADEVLDAHPLIRRWADGETVRPTQTELDELAGALRQAFFARYVGVLGEEESSSLMACIPSLAVWDDHDICDGWGSMDAAKLDAPVGRLLFEIAREFYLVFQFGCEPDDLPEGIIDQTGTSLTWHLKLPGLHVIAPDLRSERRWHRVMGDEGWRAFDVAMSQVDTGRVLLLSSVPALGPRLSWVEAALNLLPNMHKYEDDLRDQWQSRAHRTEWRRFLERLAEIHRNPATPVTLLSGEIHLATRATFDTAPAPMHQLVASGISHPAPTVAYALALDLLARLGETPVPGKPIRLHPLPGKTSIYISQRNYLVLERRSGEWSACWELEKDGRTAPLKL
jgi:hypothetical protein